MKTRFPATLASCLIALGLAACSPVGPDYTRPKTPLPAAFKENPGWKPAEPRDDKARGSWWAVFGDAQLDALLAQVANANQNVQVALAQYRQATAAAAQARADAFPELDASVAAQRSRSRDKLSTSHSLGLSASWEPDLWGGVARSVEAGEASAAASAATLASVRLSAEASLAQYYFQLRAADASADLQRATVEAYARSLKIADNQFRAGLVTRADVAQARTQLRNAEVTLTDLAVSRAQYEHAIAIMIGKAPADFSLAPAPLLMNLPELPGLLPAALLERRPDVAAAERKMAAANAQIGVARAAWFPSLSLTSGANLQSADFSQWFDAPSRVWSLGASLAATLFDGGRRNAKDRQMLSAYDVTVAQYRQTVLGALQEAEDNLVALRVLADEAEQQAAALEAAREAERLVLNQYKAGTVSYASVVSAQATANASERNAVQILLRRYVAAVQLIKALGGGWAANATPEGAGKPPRA